MKINLVGNPKIQRFMMWLLSLLMKLMLRCEISHPERMPASGPVIVIINHIAWLEPIITLGGFGRIVVPMAKQEIFDYFIAGWVMKIYKAIPVRRGEADLHAVKLALQVLKSGGAVLMAPEGTRSRTCQLQAGKAGAVTLALRANAAILPVGVTGTQQVEAYWKRLKRAPVRLSVGPPFWLRPASPQLRPQREELEAMTGEMMVRLARQLPPEWRGVYANLDHTTETYLFPAES
jgi:1-acyl-sn-glycerol-3-phosphate acyltransferase